MTADELVARIRQLPRLRDVRVTPQTDGSIEIEVEHGYRSTEWARIPPPAAADGALDDDLVRTICRKLIIPPSDVGL